ncbi:hypothetical protein Tco_0855442 [Tanacetum coccineum]
MELSVFIKINHWPLFAKKFYPNNRYSIESTIVGRIVSGIRRINRSNLLSCFIVYISWYQNQVLIKMFPRRSEDEDSEYPFFEGDGSSSNEWREYGMADESTDSIRVFFLYIFTTSFTILYCADLRKFPMIFVLAIE